MPKKQKHIGLRAAAVRVLETDDPVEHELALNELQQALINDRARVAKSVTRTRARQKEMIGR